MAPVASPKISPLATRAPSARSKRHSAPIRSNTRTATAVPARTRSSLARNVPRPVSVAGDGGLAGRVAEGEVLLDGQVEEALDGGGERHPAAVRYRLAFFLAGFRLATFFAGFLLATFLAAFFLGSLASPAAIFLAGFLAAFFFASGRALLPPSRWRR